MSRVYISNFPQKMRTRDLEDLFSEYGRILNFSVKYGAGLIEYESSKSAKRAIDNLNKSDQDGNKVIVELARNQGRRNRSGSRSSNSGSYQKYDYPSKFNSRRSGQKSLHELRQTSRRSRATPNDKCYLCGEYGHWACDCKKGDGTGVKAGRCFKCGDKGHIARKCPNVQGQVGRNKNRRSRSRSSSYSYSRSYSNHSNSYSRSRSRREKKRSRHHHKREKRKYSSSSSSSSSSSRSKSSSQSKKKKSLSSSRNKKSKSRSSSKSSSSKSSSKSK